MMKESAKGKLGFSYPTFVAYRREDGAEVVVDDRTFNPEYHVKSLDELNEQGDVDPLSKMTKAELAQMAEEMGLEVERQDRRGGNPRVEDFIAAIHAAEEEEEEEEEED